MIALNSSPNATRTASTKGFSTRTTCSRRLAGSEACTPAESRWRAMAKQGSRYHFEPLFLRDGNRESGNRCGTAAGVVSLMVTSLPMISLAENPGLRSPTRCAGWKRGDLGPGARDGARRGFDTKTHLRRGEVAGKHESACHDGRQWNPITS